MSVEKQLKEINLSLKFLDLSLQQLVRYTKNPVERAYSPDSKYDSYMYGIRKELLEKHRSEE